MITLATLGEATEQEVFDQVATHLLTQMQKCRKEGTGYCQYRNEEGLKCAAGCLISDEEYDSRMDDNTGQKGTSWRCLMDNELVPITKHAELIAGLQHIHDSWSPDTWYEDLRMMTMNHELNTTVLDTFKKN